MVAKKKTEKKTASSSSEGDAITLPEDQLGHRVKAKRLSLRLTHDGLSELSKMADLEGRGISRTSIRGYELGTYKPGAREIRILCAALHVSPSWLLFGGEDESPQSASMLSGDQGGTRARWADLVMPLIAYSQLAPAERKQVRDLVETLYRLQVGEIKFRPMKAFVEDFTDTIQDAVRDARELGTLNQDAMRAVLVDTAAAMRQKHGAAESELLLAMVGPLLDTLAVITTQGK